MFFKKRRDAKKAEREDARQEVLKDLRNRYETAMNCSDPADKFIKLEEIREMVDVATGELKGGITQRAAQNGELTFLGSMSAGTATAWIVAGLHFPPLLGLAGIIVGTVGGVRAGKRMVMHSREKQLKQNQPFIDALEVEKTKAVAAEDVLLQTRLKEMAASPKFADLVDNVPRVREHFSRAYGKKIAEENAFDSGAAPGKKPPPDNKFRL